MIFTDISHLQNKNAKLCFGHHVTSMTPFTGLSGIPISNTTLITSYDIERPESKYNCTKDE